MFCTYDCFIQSARGNLFEAIGSNTLCAEVVFSFHQLADLVKVHVLIHVKSHNLISVLPPLLPSRSLDHPAGCHQRFACRLALAQTNLAEENSPVRFSSQTQYQCRREQNLVSCKYRAPQAGQVHLKLRTFERLQLH